MKDKLFAYIDGMKDIIAERADYIFDCAEIGNKEHKSAAAIAAMLRDYSFTVEMGVAGLDTAFHAVYQRGSGGPAIGFLCEYDALEAIGHACGHQLQGPAVAAAAIALKECLHDSAYRLVVYGTPAEETSGGKIRMLEKGCFKDIDVALMFHGSPATCTDIKCMACVNFDVVFNGRSAHAAVQPENGRSALDAALLMFNGIEFMREHVKDDTRMHYTIVDAGGPANVCPKRAVAHVSLRSYNTLYLETVIERFRKIVAGAALMTETEFELIEGSKLKSKVPVLTLNDLLMENAKLANAPAISPPREKTGSTDFGNVMFEVPGSCIRVAFVPPGTSPHSQEYVDAGKSEMAHTAALVAAKVLAGTGYDLISSSRLMEMIKSEFKETKKNMAQL